MRVATASKPLESIIDLSDERDRYRSIRPYNDGPELKEALRRMRLDSEFIAEMKEFAPAVARPFMGLALWWIFRGIETVEDFQKKVAKAVVENIIEHTTAGVTYSGLDNNPALEAILQDPNQGAVFVSNHQNIWGDGALVNYGLEQYGHDTAYLAFGSNLLTMPWIEHFLRANKGFVVERDIEVAGQGNGRTGNRDLRKRVELLSDFLGEIVGDGKHALLAQGNGRTKDGDYRTQTGVIRMVLAGRTRGQALRGRSAIAPGLYANTRNIVPVAISYEWEPQDARMAAERYKRAHLPTGEQYVKDPDEDLISTRLGIRGQKGRIHVAFGEPVRVEEGPMGKVTRDVSRAIDRHILREYKIFGSHQAAFDLYADAHGMHLPHESSAVDWNRFFDRIGYYDEERKPLVIEQYARPLLKKKGMELPTA